MTRSIPLSQLELSADNVRRTPANNVMPKTLNKHIRVDPEHWMRIEEAAKQRGISPTRLMIESTLQAIDGRPWPRTDVEIHMLRSCLFTAQAMARDMMDAGRREEIEEIRRDISQIAPELPDE